MRVHKIPFEKTKKFPQLFLDYLNQKPELKSFYDLFPAPENFVKKAHSYSFSSEQRTILFNALQKQYSSIDLSEQVSKNIESLKRETTFTITTGHQLSLFTGPLYFIYKIISVIKTSEELNKKYKDLYFVPVFWMATEDHDFEEINHFYLFNKKFIWETDQKGPVGRFQNEGTEKIFEGIKEELSIFKKAYLEHRNLAQATRVLVNTLFGDKGLVIIDGDDKDLKRALIPVIKDDLVSQNACEKITEQSSALEKLDYSGQIYPREINLFYIENGLRERIVQEGNNYQVLNTNLTFGEKELINLVEECPEKFSPNVALRPVYQQMILPNVAYCGGPAEINYWLQLKSVFDYYKVSFPLLLPRLSAQIITKQNSDRMEKLGIEPEELFLSENELKSKVLQKISGKEVELNDEQDALDKLYIRIVEKAKSVDASLEGFVLAEKKNLIKSLENIEKRIRKAEETKNATSLNQLGNLLEKLFPEGKLQERRDNVLNFYLNDPEFIHKLTEIAAPFDYQFNMIYYG